MILCRCGGLLVVFLSRLGFVWVLSLVYLEEFFLDLYAFGCSFDEAGGDGVGDTLSSQFPGVFSISSHN